MLTPHRSSSLALSANLEESLKKTSSKLETAMIELKNVKEQRDWAQRQLDKLKTTVKNQANLLQEKGRIATDERLKNIQQDKLLKSNMLNLQQQLKKQAMALRANEHKINELNAALRRSPGKAPKGTRQPLLKEPAVKPTFTKMYDPTFCMTSSILTKTFELADAENQADKYLHQISEIENAETQRRILALSQKLTHIAKLEDNGETPLEHLERVSGHIVQMYSTTGKLITEEEFNDLYATLKSTQSELELVTEERQKNSELLDQVLAYSREFLERENNLV